MSETGSFANLLARVRAGEGAAAEELVRLYEPAIRRAVRFRMGDSRLNREFDSIDICQSVMGSFFVRAASGGYEIDSAEQLLRLLIGIAKNKLAAQVRHGRAERRDVRRVSDRPVDEIAIARGTPSPSEMLSAKDLLAEARRRLTDEERQLAEWRSDGVGWDEIARRTGGTVEALRKKLSRALDRVAGELGLDG